MRVDTQNLDGFGQFAKFRWDFGLGVSVGSFVVSQVSKSRPGATGQCFAVRMGCELLMKLAYGISVMASVALLILAVRLILSQLKGLPSIARLRVLNRTMEKTWR